MTYSFDIIVIGAGHAGIEAAYAASRMNLKTLLLTQNIDTIGEMSCNPSIGGLGKSHLVKEIDALGGIMAQAADLSGIQFRTLNMSKGPAVRATRAQIDRKLYKQSVRMLLKQNKNLSIIQQTVDRLLITNNKVKGVITHLNLKFYAQAIIATTGTFLNGKIHIGLNNYPGGRAQDLAAISLAENLRSLGLAMKRFKTGTPPRIAANTINFDPLTEQKGQLPIPKFSFANTTIKMRPKQSSCYISYTNEQTHEIIRKNLNQSPLYTGLIDGTGPRYCPSIEDKIVRFPDKSKHQIFLEPEGLNHPEFYPNGISTSLPFDKQIEFVRTIKGLEKAHLTRPGYAIEYDLFDPLGLKPTLETKTIKALFFAGQINGTTGYEEAAAQGLIAGLNAALLIQKKDPWWPRRHEAYIGVMLDDLTTYGTEEPYRMFTSRAEYRLLLREDNADLRLTEIGRSFGLINDHQWQTFNSKRKAIEKSKEYLKKTTIKPSVLFSKSLKNTDNTKERELSLLELLARPNINCDTLKKTKIIDILERYPEALRHLEIEQKYKGYINHQLAEVKRRLQHQETKIPCNIDYDTLSSLSNEVKQKFKEIKPINIGQAQRIPGITPAAISILLIHLKKIKAI